MKDENSVEIVRADQLDTDNAFKLKTSDDELALLVKIKGTDSDFALFVMEDDEDTIKKAYKLSNVFPAINAIINSGKEEFSKELTVEFKTTDKIKCDSVAYIAQEYMELYNELKNSIYSQREVKIGGVYHHFKKPLNENYKVLGVALHTETEDDLVIYQQMFGEGKIFARPKDMFLSYVDKNKYPEAKQLYRFEEVEESNEEEFNAIQNLYEIFGIGNIEWSNEDKYIDITAKSGISIIHDGLAVLMNDKTKIYDYNYIIIVQGILHNKKPTLIVKASKVEEVYNDIIENFNRITKEGTKGSIVNIIPTTSEVMQ